MLDDDLARKALDVLALQQRIELLDGKLCSIFCCLCTLVVTSRLDGEEEIERLLPAERCDILAEGETWQQGALPSWAERGDLSDDDIGGERRVVDLRQETVSAGASGLVRLSSPRCRGREVPWQSCSGGRKVEGRATAGHAVGAPLAR